MSSSFNKNVLVAGFTLALLIVASHRATAMEQRTGIMCTSDEMCVTICLQRGFTGGYCSTKYVVGDPSCTCTKPGLAQSMTAAPAEKQNGDAAGGMGMAD